MKIENMKLGVALVIMATVLSGCIEKGSSATDSAADASTTVVIAEGIPGGVVIDTMTVEAEVVAINHKKRSATLKSSDGEKLKVKVGPEAVNFDQIQVGDLVKAIVHEELSVYLGDEDSAGDDKVAVLAVGAEKGEQPGGAVATAMRTTATVTAVDLEAHTATLTFEDGSAETVDVRPDVELSEESVGAKVVFDITQIVAISVEQINK